MSGTPSWAFDRGDLVRFSSIPHAQTAKIKTVYIKKPLCVEDTLKSLEFHTVITNAPILMGENGRVLLSVTTEPKGDH